MSRQERNANAIGWLLIAIALLILTPKILQAIDLIATRLNQDFSQPNQIPEDKPPVSDPYQQRGQP